MYTAKSIFALAVACANVAQAVDPPAVLTGCCQLFKEEEFKGDSHELCAGSDPYEPSILPDDFKGNFESWACGSGVLILFCEDVNSECWEAEEQGGSNSGEMFSNASMGLKDLINKV